ncbi:hypothetical protein [Bacillus sp. AFS041924]|uniref:hypothetical protein n=1 Tax=Bacillus sp. AFS041924 TaxID=2033503 RepID=UPI000BFDB219|nr:hypothetical protein [Bacillus sp. AFS041924]PGS50642.1 hypothetical protein COC46_12905 [Bacillus sp. AFS041924]
MQLFPCLGYICSTESKDELKINEQLFTYSGKLICKFLINKTGAHHSIILSKRELEAMKRIAWGESTSRNGRFHEYK